MRQSDWLGDTPQAPFRDIRDTRPSVAEEKAVLAKALGELARKAPPGCMDWSMQRTHRFMEEQRAAIQAAANKRATVPELRGALERLQAYWG